MSKMNDLALSISELRDVAAAIISIADSLEHSYSSNLPTLVQVRKVLADKSRAGHTDAIRELLIKHGADRLSEIDPSHYAVLLSDAETLT